jgi:hypothetical protein
MFFFYSKLYMFLLLLSSTSFHRHHRPYELRKYDQK